MKNVLITGSEGFVGNYLQLEAQKVFKNVYLLDKLSTTKKPNYLKFNLSENDYNDVKEFFSNIKLDLIIHLAAAKGDFMLTKNEFYIDNVIATNTLAKIAVDLGVKNIIHFSTVSVYGHKNLIKNESADLNPNTTYGLTKLKSEKILIDWRKKNSTNLTILRPSVIYGEENFANMYNLLSLLNKNSITIGNGNYIKSLIAIENLIDITLFISKKMSGLQIYNCTDEPYPKLKDIISNICEIDGFREPVIKIPIWLAYIAAIPFELISFLIKKDLRVTRDRVYKYSMATDYRSDLLRSIGYEQRFSTKERLQNMANWYIKYNKL